MKTGDYRPSDLLRGTGIPDDLLKALPKTDLHCHLDGSLRLETFMELGRDVGMDMPEDPAEVRARYFPARRSLSWDTAARFRSVRRSWCRVSS